jgi:DNA polymerase/3'-5' exonuclease PolX
MKRRDGELAAWELMERLRGCCERLELGGSLRRECAEVGDVELLAVPAFGPSPYGGDLFATGKDASPMDLLLNRLRELKGQGVLSDREAKAWGDKHIRAYYGSQPRVPVDFFIVRPPASWGVIQFIRTGDREFVTRAMVRLKERGLRSEDGRILSAAGVVQPTPDEAAVFRLLGWAYVPPARRSSRPSAGPDLPPQGAAPPAAAPPPSRRAEPCPAHVWGSELIEAQPGVWRPCCVHCGAARPASDLL